MSLMDQFPASRPGHESTQRPNYDFEYKIKVMLPTNESTATFNAFMLKDCAIDMTLSHNKWAIWQYDWHITDLMHTILKNCSTVECDPGYHGVTRLHGQVSGSMKGHVTRFDCEHTTMIAEVSKALEDIKPKPLKAKIIVKAIRDVQWANAFYHKLFAIFDVKPVYVDKWNAANLALRTIPPTVPEQTQEQVGEPPAQRQRTA